MSYKRKTQNKFNKYTKAQMELHRLFLPFSIRKRSENPYTQITVN